MMRSVFIAAVTFFALLSSAKGSSPVYCEGFAELPVREEQSLTALKSELISMARMDAMKKKLGTSISGIQAAYTHSEMNTEMTAGDGFHSSIQSLVYGRWISDKHPPEFTCFDSPDQRTWMSAKVSGFVLAERADDETIHGFVSAPGLDIIKSGFTAGDPFELHIESITDGVLKIFIESEYSDTVYLINSSGLRLHRNAPMVLPPNDGSWDGQLVFTGKGMKEPSIHRIHFLAMKQDILIRSDIDKEDPGSPVMYLKKSDFYPLLLKSLSNASLISGYDVQDLIIYPQ